MRRVAHLFAGKPQAEACARAGSDVDLVLRVELLDPVVEQRSSKSRPPRLRSHVCAFTCSCPFLKDTTFTCGQARIVLCRLRATTFPATRCSTVPAYTNIAVPNGSQQ